MTQVIISLGSNINKEQNIPLAVQFLHEQCKVTAVSSVYETFPVGLPDQPNFWNMAILIETDLTPAQIKQDIINPLEIKLKRKRQSDPNAPRTIDADIVLYDDFVGEYEGGDGRVRPLPDPDLLKFPHVAVPVAELKPDMSHPVTGELMADLSHRLLAITTEREGKRMLWRRKDVSLN